jgi:hypothetical protein
MGIIIIGNRGGMERIGAGGVMETAKGPVAGSPGPAEVAGLLGELMSSGVALLLLRDTLASNGN